MVSPALLLTEVAMPTVGKRVLRIKLKSLEVKLLKLGSEKWIDYIGIQCSTQITRISFAFQGCLCWGHEGACKHLLHGQ